MIPNPSLMNLLNISGHVIFFRIHIIHSSSFNIAIYTYICEYWCKISSHHYSHYSHKNSSWNLMIAPFKTIFISSKIRSALGIMFWYLKNSLFMSSIASFIEILVYKLEKYTGNKNNHSLSNFDISNILMRLRLCTSKCFLIWNKILLNNDPQKLKLGLLSNYNLPQLVSLQ